jgi:cobalt-zinc-cadmium efflux system outer membrane protein
MRREADAAAQRVGPAGALPDPVLRVELMNINNYGNSASPSLLPSRVGETKYTMMQMLPLWGKRDLRREAAAADAAQATDRSESSSLARSCASLGRSGRPAKTSTSV